MAPLKREGQIVHSPVLELVSYPIVDRARGRRVLVEFHLERRQLFLGGALPLLVLLLLREGALAGWRPGL